VSSLLQRIAQEPAKNITHFYDMNKVSAKYPTLKYILQSPALQNPSAHRLYKDKYIDNCYLLKEHNQNVFNTFKKQFPCFAQEINTSEDIQELFGSLKEFKRYFHAYLLLHDVGKPLGPLCDQHKNTTPIMSAYLQKWGFNKKHIALAKVLVNSDIIGDMAVAGLSINKAYATITQNAHTLNIHPKTLCALHHLFWACDAGSYKSLAGYITTDKETGKYIPTMARKHVKEVIDRCKKGN